MMQMRGNHTEVTVQNNDWSHRALTSVRYKHDFMSNIVDVYHIK